MTRRYYILAGMKRLLIILLALAAFAAWRDWSQREVIHPPGIVVPERPRQEMLAAVEPLDLASKGYLGWNESLGQGNPLAPGYYAALPWTCEPVRYDVVTRNIIGYVTRQVIQSQSPLEDFTLCYERNIICHNFLSAQLILESRDLYNKATRFSGAFVT